jgi:hypothetical protein
VPQFHIMDLSCGEQDPNGPMFGPSRGVKAAFAFSIVDRRSMVLLYGRARGCSTSLFGIFRSAQIRPCPRHLCAGTRCHLPSSAACYIPT